MVSEVAAAAGMPGRGDLGSIGNKRRGSKASIIRRAQDTPKDATYFTDHSNPPCVEPGEFDWSTCPPAQAQAQAQGFSLAAARLLAMPPSNRCQ